MTISKEATNFVISLYRDYSILSNDELQKRVQALLDAQAAEQYGRGVSAGKAEALAYSKDEREAYGHYVAQANLFYDLKEKHEAQRKKDAERIRELETALDKEQRRASGGTLLEQQKVINSRLKAEIEQLKREYDAVRDNRDAEAKSRDGWIRRHAALRAEVEKLRAQLGEFERDEEQACHLINALRVQCEKLRGYVEHKAGCEKDPRTYDNSPAKCTCGLDALLNQSEKGVMPSCIEKTVTADGMAQAPNKQK